MLSPLCCGLLLGGMLNGLLTLRGAWDKLRTDPVIILRRWCDFLRMATFEGPLMSIKSVNALSHYTDWTIGHVHGGTLGWNGFMANVYWLAHDFGTPIILKGRPICTARDGWHPALHRVDVGLRHYPRSYAQWHQRRWHLTAIPQFS